MQTSTRWYWDFFAIFKEDTATTGFTVVTHHDLLTGDFILKYTRRPGKLCKGPRPGPLTDFHTDHRVISR
jgi:hypothetical protein